MKSRQAPKPAHRVSRLTAQRRVRFVAAVIAVLALWLLMSPTAEAKKPPPPAQRTYFVIFLGLMGDSDSEAVCLRFDRRRVCDDEGVCGTWEQGEIADKQSGVSFQIEFIEEGFPIAIDGSARIDDRRKRSSLGGAAKISADGQLGNFALVGREVPLARCRRLEDAFNARATAE